MSAFGRCDYVARALEVHPFERGVAHFHDDANEMNDRIASAHCVVDAGSGDDIATNGGQALVLRQSRRVTYQRDNIVPFAKQPRKDMTAHESSRAGEKNPHRSELYVGLVMISRMARD